jgi:hypothetical protein
MLYNVVPPFESASSSSGGPMPSVQRENPRKLISEQRANVSLKESRKDTEVWGKGKPPPPTPGRAEVSKRVNLKRQERRGSRQMQSDCSGTHGTQGRMFGTRQGIENDPGYRSSSDAEDGFEDGFEQ